LRFRAGKVPGIQGHARDALAAADFWRASHAAASFVELGGEREIQRIRRLLFSGLLDIIGSRRQG